MKKRTKLDEALDEAPVEEPKPVYDKEEWICVGRCTITGDTPGMEFRRPNGEKVFISAKKLKHIYAGNVYEARVSPTQVLTDMKYIREHDDLTERAVMQAEDRAYQIEQRYLKERGKAQQHQSMVDLLEPLRRSYLTKDWAGRTALEMTILHYLRYGV